VWESCGLLLDYDSKKNRNRQVKEEEEGEEGVGEGGEGGGDGVRVTPLLPPTTKEGFESVTKCNS
jgi:hypothetical protein